MNQVTLGPGTLCCEGPHAASLGCRDRRRVTNECPWRFRGIPEKALFDASKWLIWQSSAEQDIAHSLVFAEAGKATYTTLHTLLPWLFCYCLPIRDTNPSQSSSHSFALRPLFNKQPSRAQLCLPSSLPCVLYTHTLDQKAENLPSRLPPASVLYPLMPCFARGSYCGREAAPVP